MLVEIKVTEEFIAEMEQYRKKPDGKSLLEACSDSPILFAEFMLGMRLYAWQVYFINKLRASAVNETSLREFLALTSRQIGKSTVAAVFSLWACTFNKKPGTLHNNTIVGVVSATDVQAKKLLHEIKKLIKAGDKYMELTYKDKGGESLFGKKFFTSLLDDKEPNNTTTITFKSHKPETHGKLLLAGSNTGSVIKSYPPTDSVLGETFTIVMEDEAGKTDKITDQFHYEYVYPTGNSTDAVRVYTSTPWVTSGFFYRLADPSDEYLDHPADRVMFTIDAIRLENPDYYNNVVEKTIKPMNRDGKTDEVQRAYYCRFVKGEAAYFNPDRVREIFKDYTPLDKFSKECDMGVDFGGEVVSRTVITISALDDNKQITRLYHRTYPAGDKGLTLVDDIAELKRYFNVQRIIVDDCPAGWHLTEKMSLKGWTITPMNFRSEKVKKYGAFRAAVNRQEVQSYDDAELRTEMLALEFSQGSKQSIIQHAPGYTDDLIDSFVMSCYYFVQEDRGFRYYDLDDVEDDDNES